MLHCASLTVAVLFCVLQVCATGSASLVQFSRDIRPILANSCFQCHGPSEKDRQADLRLDEEDGLRSAFRPNDLAGSEGWLRINSTDPDVRMPPPSAHKELTSEEIALIGTWIEQGAPWEGHWAFLPPRRVPLPELRATNSVRNAIDHFILARLAEAGWRPSEEADRRTLIRRVTLDLTGLPPLADEVVAFLADDSEDAYERVVQRLLASSHYGERMALDWLDAARYADTHGFNNDSARTMWRWRDWVIDAFNDNLSYDRFIVDQIAGDLLPEATLQQIVATGFNRNHVINSEGGIISEEYRVEYVADRVRTTGMAFMGLTLECARCHDHKFDPITQADYYRLFAFFNNVPEVGEDGRVSNAAPIMAAPTDAQQAQLAQVQSALHSGASALRKRRDQLPPDPAAAWVAELRQIFSSRTPAYPDNVQVHLPLDRVANGKIVDRVRPQAAIASSGKLAFSDGIDGTALVLDGKCHLDLDRQIKLASNERFSIGMWIRPDDLDSAALMSKMDFKANEASGAYGKGFDLRVENERVSVRLSERWPAYAIHVSSEPTLHPRQWQHLMVTWDGSNKAHGLRIYHDGHELDTTVHRDGVDGGGSSGAPLLIGRGNVEDEPGFRGQMDDVRVFSGTLTADEIAAFVQPLLVAHAFETHREEILSHYYLLESDATYRHQWQEHEQLRDQLLELRHRVPMTMVMAEMPQRRATYILTRGHYASRADQVQPAVLEQLLVPLPPGAPPTRLGLARWLTRADHPLTARVAVNRIWQQLFGTGLVKTAEDFGLQGELPSHPSLLDWLAVEFVESGWDIKALVRQIVTSATYRQSSQITPELLKRDPENRLLARGPRFRLPAELIRDQALAVSGLLHRRIGGPSVYPYQPAGIYQDVVVGADYPGTKWLESEGAGLYRRGIYTFWKRTLPHPALVAFDAPDREFCLLRRSRTSTPLQALVLLNDPTYLEASRKLAERVLHERSDPPARIAQAFELITARPPSTMVANQARLPIAPSIFKFSQHGESGSWVSELLPYTARCVDELCIVHSMHTEAINHDPAITFIQTGSQQPGRPSMGAWIDYGLGCEAEDLPAFVVLVSLPGNRTAGQGLLSRLWGSGMLPSMHQGVKLRSTGDPVLYLSDPAGVDGPSRREMLDSIASLNRLRHATVGDPEIETRIAQYEMAYRMQTSVPELMDLSGEPQHTLDLYGQDVEQPGTYARNCLLARRLAERGVRFIQLYHRGWDQHGNLPEQIASQCQATDQATAALIRDLRQRGMLEDTLVIWGGEFGRTVYCQGGLTDSNYGRDHHGRCFTTWLAGGGVRPGIRYGASDDFSFSVAEKPMHIHDLQATVMHCLGIDHEKLVYRFAGRDFRLTDVHGIVTGGILS